MTYREFGRECVDYYGSWKAAVHGDAVAGYVKTKAPSFIAALWKIVRERRGPGEGPPALSDLMKLATEAAEYAGTRLAQPQIGDGEERASAEDVHRVMEEVAEKLAAKKVALDMPVVEKPRRKLFEELDDVRADTPVVLMAEFYDETMTMEDRIASYSRRRQAIEEARKGKR